jgi:hypothetical protein
MTGGKDATLDQTTDLTTFLENSEDVFRMEEHFQNWTQADRDYPIMLLKYDALWTHLPEWFAFLGVPSAAMDDFPERRPRKSNYADEPSHIREGLQSLYGDLNERIEAHSDVRII